MLNASVSQSSVSASCSSSERRLENLRHRSSNAVVTDWTTEALFSIGSNFDGTERNHRDVKEYGSAGDCQKSRSTRKRQHTLQVGFLEEGEYSLDNNSIIMIITAPAQEISLSLTATIILNQA